MVLQGIIQEKKKKHFGYLLISCMVWWSPPAYKIHQLWMFLTLWIVQWDQLIIPNCVLTLGDQTGDWLLWDIGLFGPSSARSNSTYLLSNKIRLLDLFGPRLNSWTHPNGLFIYLVWQSVQFDLRKTDQKIPLD